MWNILFFSQGNTRGTDGKLCVYLLLKKLTGGPGVNEVALTGALDRAKAEHRASRRLISGGDVRSVWEEARQKKLQHWLRLQMCSVSKSIVHVGEGKQQRPLEHLANTLNVAAGVSTRMHATANSSGCTYLLSRGVGNYDHDQAEEQASPLADRTIAYCNVLSTDCKSVSTYVELCVEQYLVKSMTLEEMKTQKKKMVTTLRKAHHPDLLDVIFHPSVMYFIACHIAKRVLHHCDQMEYYALREFAPSLTLICLHQMSVTRSGVYSLQSLRPEEADRFTTAIHLRQAERVELKSATTDIREQLYISMTKVAVS